MYESFMLNVDILIRVAAFVQGIICNSLLIVTTMNLYYFVGLYKGIDIQPGTITFVQLVTGFIVQCIYPHIMNHMNKHIKIAVLYTTILFSTVLLTVYSMVSNYLISVVFLLIAVNSYFGEVYFVASLTEHSESCFTYWVIGTSLCGIITTSLSLFLSQYFTYHVVYIIFHIMYLFFLTLSIFMIEVERRMQIKNNDRTNTYSLNDMEMDTISSDMADDVTIIDNMSEQTINDERSKREPENRWIKILKDYKTTLLMSSPLWLESFFRYFLILVLLPHLITESKKFEIVYFCNMISIFVGKNVSNLYLVKNIYLYNLIHIYNVLLLTVVYFFYQDKYYYYLLVATIISITINSTCYSQVYNTVMNSDVTHKTYYISFIWQYSTLATIIATAFTFIIYK